MIKKLVIAALCAAAFSPDLSHAAAPYPARSVKVIVPYSAGGTADAVARMISNVLSEQLGQPFVIENRDGASAMLGTNAVARAAPDGYTLGVIISTHVVNPFVQPKISYDAVKDFAPITTVAEIQGLMVAHPSLGVRSLQELVTFARREPGKLNYAVPGTLTNGHVTMEMLNVAAGIRITPIIYRGAAPATLDVLSGNVQVMTAMPAPFLKYAQTGQLIPLASTGTKRLKGFENVPTIREAGFPDIVTYEWIAFVAPAQTPPAVIKVLSNAIAHALAQPSVIAGLEAFSAEPVGLGPDELHARLTEGLARMRELTKALPLTP